MNRKLCRKEMSKINGGKMKRCSRIKNKTCNLAVCEDGVKNLEWLFEDVYNFLAKM